MILITAIFLTFIAALFFSKIGKLLAKDEWVNKYFIMEIIITLIAVLIYKTFGNSILTVKFIIFTLFVVTLSNIDLRTHWLPDKLMFP